MVLHESIGDLIDILDELLVSFHFLVLFQFLRNFEQSLIEIVEHGQVIAVILLLLNPSLEDGLIEFLFLLKLHLANERRIELVPQILNEFFLLAPVGGVGPADEQVEGQRCVGQLLAEFEVLFLVIEAHDETKSMLRVHYCGDVVGGLGQAELLDSLQQQGCYFQIFAEVVQTVDGHLQSQILRLDQPSD